MLKILDRYILRKYLGTFFFISLLFSMLAVVIDFTDKVEDFMGDKAPPMSEILLTYYLNFIPYISSILFPLFTLIAVIFFTSRLASSSEIIGMIGNGVHFYRILVPYLVAAGLISSIHYIGNHYLFPLSNRERVHFENTYIWKHNYNSPTDNVHFFMKEGEEVYFRTFNRKDSSGLNFWLMHYDSSGVQRPYTLVAHRIESKGDNRWTLRNYYLREVNGMNERITRGKQLDTTLNFRVSDLVRRDNYQAGMTSAELAEYIAIEKKRGLVQTVLYEVELERRSADPFTNIVLTIIGFAIASRKTRGGMGWHLVLGIGISALYIFMTKFSTTFSTNGGLSPFLGVWLPNFVFTGVALGLLLGAKK